jgi:hypothetical protein
MADIENGNPIKSTSDIRIVGLNTGKTRRTLGSYKAYQVYFELSGNPPRAWRDIFGREWNNLNQSQEAAIDGKFLVLHCLLTEIASKQLPALKDAVGATNISFKRFVLEQATDDERKADVRKKERKTVEAIARTLTFE